MKTLLPIATLLFIHFSVFPARAQVTQDWVKRYNGPAGGTDSALAVAVDAVGNVFVTGSSNQAGGMSDMYTAKYAGASGALIWERRRPANESRTIAVDATGNAVISGGGYTAKYSAAT